MTYKLVLCELRWLKNDFINIMYRIGLLGFILVFISALLILYLGSLYFPKILMIIAIFIYIEWIYEAHKECRVEERYKEDD